MQSYYDTPRFSEAVMEHGRRRWPDLGDRHIGVALFLGAWLIAVPPSVCWLSSHPVVHDSRGRPYHVWAIAGWVGAYFIMVASAYLVYWFGEGMWGAFKCFRKALSA